MGEVQTQAQLKNNLQTLQQQGKTVATTNGCFDILHTGHLRYLQAAKAQTDVLVVLLNSDDSVRRLKGSKRPIVPQDERAELLAGLACIDYVVIFNEDSPQQLLSELKPNIHVKGGDYDATTLPEAPLLQQLGCKLVFIPFIAGQSTTNVIAKIVDAYSCSHSTP